MAWGTRYVSEAAKGQCGWSRIRWTRRVIDFSGFFHLHLTKTFPKLLHWIKREGKRKGNVLANVILTSMRVFIWAKGDWGTKTRASGTCLSLGLASGFFSPRSSSDGHPTSRFSSYLFSHHQKWVPLSPSRSRNSPENHVHLPCLAHVPFLSP